MDLCDVDQVRFPLVKEAVYKECIIGPGDMLFIPRWHWHFVKAIDEQTAMQWRTKHTETPGTGMLTAEHSNANIHVLSSNHKYVTPLILVCYFLYGYLQSKRIGAYCTVCSVDSIVGTCVQ